MPTPRRRGRGGADRRAPTRDGASCTGPATRPTGAALAAAAGLRSDRVVEDAAHGLGDLRRGRAGRAPSRARPASASTRPRTCRSARAGWSPPTTPTAPTWMRRARLHGMTPGRLAALPARRELALRRRGRRPQGQHDRPAGGDRAGPAAPPDRTGSGAGPSSPPGTTRAARRPRRCGRLPRPARPAGTPGICTSSRVGPATRWARDDVVAALAERGVGTLGALHPACTACRTSATCSGRRPPLPGGGPGLRPAAVPAPATRGLTDARRRPRLRRCSPT